MFSHRNFSAVPSLEEQITVIQSIIDGVRIAFTQLTGEGEEQLTDPEAIYEIECLEATR